MTKNDQPLRRGECCLHADYKVRVEVSSLAGLFRKFGFRRGTAWVLRGIADKITGETTVAITMRTNPPLADLEHCEIIGHGLRRAGELLSESLGLAIADKATEELMPGDANTPIDVIRIYPPLDQ